MFSKPITEKQLVEITRLWLAAGGRNEIELGALEPTLWKEGDKRVDAVVGSLSALGCVVNMTTNGTRLKHMAAELKDAGLNLLRISWHSTNPAMFREISGGHGNYVDFIDGINAAANAGIPMSFNKVLLRGTENDFSEQLDFIQRHDSKLKLYDLIWTPEIAAIYNESYVDWRGPVKEHVLPRTDRIERSRTGIGRSRIGFHLIGGGLVEVKVSDQIDRSKEPCNTCNHKKVCLEDFGDYARVDPSMRFYACYLRKDIGFSLPSDLPKANPKDFSANIASMLGDQAEGFLKKTALRFTLMPSCNFNCRMPGTTQSWCMEANDSYRYPKLRVTTLESSQPSLGG